MKLNNYNKMEHAESLVENEGVCVGFAPSLLDCKLCEFDCRLGTTSGASVKMALKSAKTYISENSQKVHKSDQKHVKSDQKVVVLEKRSFEDRLKGCEDLLASTYITIELLKKEMVEHVDSDRVEEILGHVLLRADDYNAQVYISNEKYQLLCGVRNRSILELLLFNGNFDYPLRPSNINDFDIIPGKINDAKLGDLFILNDSDLTKISFPEGILIIGFRDEKYVNANFLFGNCICYTKYGLADHEGIILRRKL